MFVTARKKAAMLLLRLRMPSSILEPELESGKLGDKLQGKEALLCAVSGPAELYHFPGAGAWGLLGS